MPAAPRAAACTDASAYAQAGRKLRSQGPDASQRRHGSVAPSLAKSVWFSGRFALGLSFAQRHVDAAPATTSGRPPQGAKVSSRPSVPSKPGAVASTDASWKTPVAHLSRNQAPPASAAQTWSGPSKKPRHAPASGRRGRKTWSAPWPTPWTHAWYAFVVSSRKAHAPSMKRAVLRASPPATRAAESMPPQAKPCAWNAPEPKTKAQSGSARRSAATRSAASSAAKTWFSRNDDSDAQSAPSQPAGLAMDRLSSHQASNMPLTPTRGRYASRTA
mmetsp:Transcript_11377/g.39157  ORF Transcript_11377/g.39157 Transcript_11377/m.39157 type:complete len:274 (+) Transcript_11377:105-926(+)